MTPHGGKVSPPRVISSDSFFVPALPVFQFCEILLYFLHLFSTKYLPFHRAKKRRRSSQSSKIHLPFMYPSTNINIPSCNFFKFLTCNVTLYPSHIISLCANGHSKLFSMSVHSSLDKVCLLFCMIFSLAAHQAPAATPRRPPARGGFAWGSTVHGMLKGHTRPKNHGPARRNVDGCAGPGIAPLARLPALDIQLAQVRQ